MASLAGQLIKDSYKDLLTVASITPNQGFESSVKQIFDGEGIGSAMWMSTSLLQVGTSGSNANLTVYGDIKSKVYKMINTSGDTEILFTMDGDSNLNVIPDLITKGSVTFQKAGSDDLVMDAENSSMKKGDGTKGNVKLEDTSVKLQKGSTDLLEIKEDGTLILKNVSSLPSSPDAGDIVNYNGALWINL